MKSKIVELGPVSFPEFCGDQIYMESIPGNLGRWADFIQEQVMKLAPTLCGSGYLTVDEKEVMPGSSHRRGGPHTDGNYLYGWGGGGGWNTGEDGRVLTREKHLAQYCAEGGGMIIASTYAACRAWVGDFTGEPDQGGNCEAIDLTGMDSFLLKPNTLYLANSTCIHESIPIMEKVKRQLFRLTLPHTVCVP